MSLTVVRYRVRAERADENAALVGAVFAELQAAPPEGLRYACLRLEDDTFVHVARDGAALPSLAAFGRFRAGLGERALEPPVALPATLVGNHGLLVP